MTILRYDETHDWAYVNLNGSNTWEPVSYLSVDEEGTGSQFRRPRSTHLSSVSSGAGNRKRALVIADFEGIEKSEMTVKKGELVMVSREEGEWLLGEVGSRV